MAKTKQVKKKREKRNRKESAHFANSDLVC